MGGLNSGSRLRSERLRDDQLPRLSVHDVRRAFGAHAMSRQIRLIEPVGAGLDVAVAADGGYALRIVPDHNPGSIPYGVPEALSSSSPRQFISLAVTEPNFGGVRYWFRCPRPTCGRRSAVLYREPWTNARAFACRRCVQFRYATQVLGDADLIGERIEKSCSLDSLCSQTARFAAPRACIDERFSRSPVGWAITSLGGSRAVPLYGTSSAHWANVRSD